MHVCVCECVYAFLNTQMHVHTHILIYMAKRHWIPNSPNEQMCSKYPMLLNCQLIYIFSNNWIGFTK